MTVSSIPPQRVTYRKWWVLTAVSLSLFLGSIDGSIVNVALPTLMKDLKADFPTVQWIILAYLLGLTILMVSMGRLADLIGKKLVFTSGLVLFVLGSALCGLSPDVYWLIGFRFLQSIGAAMMLALGVAIITQTWPSTERGKAIGFAGGVISLGIVIGPAIGGFLLQWLSWRWIFYVNLPIGVAALILVLIHVPALKPAANHETFDVVGALLLGGGLLTFALALTVGQNLGFTAPPILLLFGIFLVCIPLFIRHERRTTYPMVDLSLFRVPQFSLNLFTGWVAFVAIAGVVFLLPFYLELVVGLSLRDVGLMMAVVPIVMGILQPLTGSFSDRWGTRPVSVVGLVLLFLGYLAMSTIQADGSPLGFVMRMLPLAVGMSAFNSPNNSAIMGSVPQSRLGVASGILSMVRTLGQVTGIALLGAVFNSRLQLYGGEGIGLRSASAEAIVAALHDQFLLAAALLAITVCVAIWTWRKEIEARKSPAAELNQSQTMAEASRDS